MIWRHLEDHVRKRFRTQLSDRTDAGGMPTSAWAWVAAAAANMPTRTWASTPVESLESMRLSSMPYAW